MKLMLYLDCVEGAESVGGCGVGGGVDARGGRGRN